MRAACAGGGGVGAVPGLGPPNVCTPCMRWQASWCLSLHVHAHPVPSLCRPGLYCFTVVSGSAVVNSSAVYTIVGKSDLAASPLQDSVATLDAVGPAQCVGLTDNSCCFPCAGPTPCSTHSETRCFSPLLWGPAHLSPYRPLGLVPRFSGVRVAATTGTATTPCRCPTTPWTSSST